MKIKKTYKIAGLLLLYIVLQSRSGGPGTIASLQVAGAPGSTGSVGTCGNSGCHSQGSFSPALAMSLLEGENLITKYEPGKTYTLKLTTTPGQGSPAGYGFQAVALNSSDLQAGDWGTPGSGKHVVTLSNRKYIEHSEPAANGVFELPWIAPQAGSGDVTFYAASLASNLNSSVGGDGVAKNMLTITESGLSNVSNVEKEFASIKVIPNPVGEVLTVQVTSRRAGSHKIRVIDATGAVVQAESVSLHVGINQAAFQVSNLAPGVYILQLLGEDHIAATQMLKR
jgi:hypothetical protein